jgi:hypothetical protein
MVFNPRRGHNDCSKGEVSRAIPPLRNPEADLSPTPIAQPPDFRKKLTLLELLVALEMRPYRSRCLSGPILLRADLSPVPAPFSSLLAHRFASRRLFYITQKLGPEGRSRKPSGKGGPVPPHSARGTSHSELAFESYGFPKLRHAEWRRRVSARPGRDTEHARRFFQRHCRTGNASIRYNRGLISPAAP